MNKEKTSKELSKIFVEELLEIRDKSIYKSYITDDLHEVYRKIPKDNYVCMTTKECDKYFSDAFHLGLFMREYFDTEVKLPLSLKDKWDIAEAMIKKYQDKKEQEEDG